MSYGRQIIVDINVFDEKNRQKGKDIRVICAPRTSIIRAGSFYFHDCDPSVTLAVLSYTERGDPRVAAQVAPKDVFERSRTFAVYHPNGTEAGEHGLVEIFVKGVPTLLTGHAAQVDLVPEIP